MNQEVEQNTQVYIENIRAHENILVAREANQAVEQNIQAYTVNIRVLEKKLAVHAMAKQDNSGVMQAADVNIALIENILPLGNTMEVLELNQNILEGLIRPSIGKVTVEECLAQEGNILDKLEQCLPQEESILEAAENGVVVESIREVVETSRALVGIIRELVGIMGALEGGLLLGRLDMDTRAPTIMELIK